MKYTIFKNDEVAQQNELVMTVAAIGTVAGYTGYGFDGLSTEDKAKVAAAIGVPILLLLLTIYIVIRRSRRRRRRSHVARV